MRRSTPFVVGTTSYIYPVEEDNLLENVRRLKDRVEKIQLLAFGRHYLDDLFTPHQVTELAAVQADSGVRYSIHMPVDLGLLSDDQANRAGALDVMDDILARTARLTVDNYILHLDPFMAFDYRPLAYDEAMRGLFEEVLGALGRRFQGLEHKFCLENTGYDLTVFQPVIDRTLFAVCMDFGHLWMTGQDVPGFIASFGARVRDVHLHGIVGGKDHKSLSGLSGKQKTEVGNFLKDYNYSVILEVFNEQDLESSLGLIPALTTTSMAGHPSPDGVS